MSTAVSSTEEVQAQGTVLQALRQSKGRVTLGDVVANTGLSRDDAEGALKVLLTTHEGHLEVSEDGDLVYLFDPKLVRRDHRTGWQRFKEKAYAGFKAGFKVWIMLMLVVYFVIYVCLALAAFAALNSQNRESSSSSRRGGGIPLHWLIYIFWTPDWRYGHHYYGDAHYSGRRREIRVPFYKKVFAFVFGPDELEKDPQEKDRLIAQLIRSKRGVLTTEELIEVTGDDYAHAESEMGRLLGAFDGEAHVTDDGQMVYTFPELMLSTEEKVQRGAVKPAWRSLEQPKLLTGNKAGSNTLVGFLNGFNLLFSLISPTTIFPILGIAGIGAMIGLVYVPMIFSLLFFAIPLVRAFTVRRENSARHERNARRLALKEVFEAARSGDATVQADAMSKRVASSLREAKTKGDSSIVATAIRATLSEFDADIDMDVDLDTGDKEAYVFSGLQQTLEGSEATRRSLALDTRKVGDIVFSSADDEKTAEEREIREFEKELAEVEVPEGVEVH